MPEAFDFAVSGINHNHIYGQVDAMLGAGCRLTAFYAPEDDLAAEFAKAYPQAPPRRRRARDPRRPGRAPGRRRRHPRRPRGDGAPRHARRQGRDGRQARLHHRGAARRAPPRRRPRPARIYSICYSEHYLQKSTVAASRLVAEGAIGRVVHTIGLGPHRHRPAPPPRLVLGHRPRRRHPRRHRRAPVRAVPALHRLDLGAASCRASRPTSTTPTAPAGTTTATPSSPPTTPPASSASTG